LLSHSIEVYAMTHVHYCKDCEFHWSCCNRECRSYVDYLCLECFEALLCLNCFDTLTWLDSKEGKTYQSRRAKGRGA
jgi:hypothetical protein